MVMGMVSGANQRGGVREATFNEWRRVMEKPLKAVWKAIPEGFRNGNKHGDPIGSKSPDQSGNFLNIRYSPGGRASLPSLTFYPHPGLGNRLRVLSNHEGVLVVTAGTFTYYWRRQESSFTGKQIFSLPVDFENLKKQGRDIWMRIDIHAGSRLRT